MNAVKAGFEASFCIPNIRKVFHLIDAGHMEHLENLQTDLQLVLGMVQWRGNTEKGEE